MRIAFFISIMAAGGSERSTNRLARELIARNYQIDIVASTVRDAMLAEIPAGVRLFDLKAEGTARAIFPYIRYLWKENPDLVISCPSSVSFVAAMVNGTLTRRRPLIFAQRSTEAVLHDPQTKVRYWLQQKAITPVYRRAEAVMAVSRGVADQLCRIPGMRRERIHVIHSPTWSPAIEEKSREPVSHPWFNEADSPPIIIVVGRLAPEKGLDTLLRALDLLRRRRPARLVMLGEGEERAALERQIAELGLGDLVSMPGFDPNPFAYMARAALLVVAARQEGFANTMVEAMACGLPVLSTDAPGGSREILEGGYGPLVPVDDPGAMAEAMEKVLAAPPDPERLRAHARRFSATATADAVETMIRSVVSHHAPAPIGQPAGG